MKRLVVCTDGTWNSRDSAKEDGSGLTNVAKIERAVAPRDAAGVLQHSLYHAGVGIGPWYERMVGGAFGVGLSRNVQACYSWLVELYEPGDELYLFGFSRGAYTARSLAGLIRNCGLLQREHRARVAEAYTLYRDRKPDAHPNAGPAVEFRTKYAHEPRIHCIGVWDTVGALGVPTSGLAGWWTKREYAFHDVTLSSRIDHAFHALAIDERRKPFQPALWEVPDSDLAPDRTQRVEQVWFAGVHSNVGGGYPDCGLSDAALHWMMDRARSCGLALRPEIAETVKPRCDATLHDSMSTFYRAMGVFERSIMEQRTGRDGRPVHTFEDVHDSVFERRRSLTPPKSPYDPPNLRTYVQRYGERAPSVAPTPAASPATNPVATAPLADAAVRAPAVTLGSAGMPGSASRAAEPTAPPA